MVLCALVDIILFNIWPVLLVDERSQGGRGVGDVVTMVEGGLDDLSLRQFGFMLGFGFRNALMDGLPFQPFVDPPSSFSVAWVRRRNTFSFVAFINGHMCR